MQYLEKKRFILFSITKLLKRKCCIRLFPQNLIKLLSRLDSASCATKCQWLIIEECEESIWNVNIQKFSEEKLKELNEVHDVASVLLLRGTVGPLWTRPPANKRSNYCTRRNNRRFICPHKDTRCREHNTDIDTHTVVQAGTHLCQSRAFAAPGTILSHFSMSHGPGDRQGRIINNWLELRSS